MSRLNVHLCVLLFVFSIAVQFGDCQNDTCDIENIGKSESGSDQTRLSWIEKILKRLLKPVENTGNAIENIIDHIHGRKNNATQSNNKKSFGDVLEQFADQVHLIAPGNLD